MGAGADGRALTAAAVEARAIITLENILRGWGGFGDGQINKRVNK